MRGRAGGMGAVAQWKKEKEPQFRTSAPRHEDTHLSAAGDRHLDQTVLGKREHGAGGEKRLRVFRSRKNLQQHRGGGWDEGDAVHRELAARLRACKPCEVMFHMRREERGGIPTTEMTKLNDLAGLPEDTGVRG